MQHHHMQAVALDPFAAIDEAPQGAKLTLDLDAEGVLDRVHGAHLVGDRADAADARNDIGHLLVAPSPQERLEEARRLEDPELRRGHLAIGNLEVERTFALDPRDVLDLDGFSRHGPRPLYGMARRPR